MAGGWHETDEHRDILPDLRQTARPMNLGLEGRACIVTGATRGIGRTVAGALHAEGARVLLVARDALLSPRVTRQLISDRDS
ncbi:MAG: SDR family NAD(P)-dependent oxidoreductase [Solirubrobacterales bacterium]|nr:SDR family NAD(P)-dependent oxidoreductase [Solirubrobacterales bacterium]